ncbi:MAG: sulfite oxidase heme-binding subunit YedZ [Alphaproteobacteria bacterium]
MKKVLKLPWLDRSGGLSPLKLAVFACLFVPGLWVSLSYGAGALGARPLTEVLHQAGLWAIRFLFISLAISPLRRILDWPHLVTVRRMVGVAAFAYAASHLTLYTIDEMLDLAKVVREIVLRFYLTIGFVTLLSLSALAATSTDAMTRRLGGRRWRTLHRLVYGIAALAVVHYFIQAKANVSEPFMMAGFYVWLMGYRLIVPAPSERPLARYYLALSALTLAAPAATALGEALYFWLKLGVDPARVLMADLSLAAGVRPALIVLVAGVLVLAASVLRLVKPRPVAIRTPYFQGRP